MNYRPFLRHEAALSKKNHKDLAGFTKGNRPSCEILTQGVTNLSFEIDAYFLV